MGIYVAYFSHGKKRQWKIEKIKKVPVLVPFINLNCILCGKKGRIKKIKKNKRKIHTHIQSLFFKYLCKDKCLFRKRK